MKGLPPRFLLCINHFRLSKISAISSMVCRPTFRTGVWYSSCTLPSYFRCVSKARVLLWLVFCLQTALHISEVSPPTVIFDFFSAPRKMVRPEVVFCENVFHMIVNFLTGYAVRLFHHNCEVYFFRNPPVGLCISIPSHDAR